MYTGLAPRRSHIMAHDLIARAHRIIPPLDGTLHKGQAGRIGIVGGSKDYTGAPFFSGYAALRLGVDLSHIICEPSAAHVIKTYSPDLMVHSYLSSPTADFDLYRSNKLEFEQLLDRLHVLVIGPGLGRDQEIQDWAEWAIKTSIEKNIYMVLDADALWLLQSKPNILGGYQQIILTPNKIEFQRLVKASLKINPNLNDHNTDLLLELSKTLGGCTILLKSRHDIVAQFNSVPLTITEKGSPKRCGGQGDILSGLVGTWLAWTKLYLERSQQTTREEEDPKQTSHLNSNSRGEKNQQDKDEILTTNERMIISAALGSLLARRSAYLAFKKFGRAMQSSDILNFIAEAFQVDFKDDFDDD